MLNSKQHLTRGGILLSCFCAMFIAFPVMAIEDGYNEQEVLDSHYECGPYSTDQDLPPYEPFRMRSVYDNTPPGYDTEFIIVL